MGQQVLIRVIDRALHSVTVKDEGLGPTAQPQPHKLKGPQH